MNAGIQSFIRHHGIVVPLDRSDIDTDQIIPKQFLKSVKKTGFGSNLFDSWRFIDEGEIGKTDRTENPDFVLNFDRYRKATILLTRRNFGCGSSREHAVWALLQYGFRCVLAPSFADIFYNNSINNGFLPIALCEERIEELFVRSASRKPLELVIDLESKEITIDEEASITFDIDSRARTRLLEGMDDIGMTLKHHHRIEEFETRHRRVMPWLFADST